MQEGLDLCAQIRAERSPARAPGPPVHDIMGIMFQSGTRPVYSAGENALVRWLFYAFARRRAVWGA